MLPRKGPGASTSSETPRYHLSCERFSMCSSGGVRAIAGVALKVTKLCPNRHARQRAQFELVLPALYSMLARRTPASASQFQSVFRLRSTARSTTSSTPCRTSGAHDLAAHQPACNLRKFIGRTPLATGLILRCLQAAAPAGPVTRRRSQELQAIENTIAVANRPARAKATVAGGLTSNLIEQSERATGARLP